MAESSDESGDEVEESEKSSGHERSIARRIKKQRVSIDKGNTCAGDRKLRLGIILEII